MALLGFGCLQSPTVAGADGTICVDGQVSLVSTGGTVCATPEQIALCENLADGAPCGAASDLSRCFNGFCQPSLCGNGVVDSSVGEACEPDVAIVAVSCSQRYCGDGVVDADEECDGEAVWALPDPSDTCPTGTPLQFSLNGPNGMATADEQTLGPSRYFLTLRARNGADLTEYPVALDYSCNRVD